MRMEIILLPSDLLKLYNELSEKYDDFDFTNIEEEKEYIIQLKKLLDVPQSENEFEEKLFLVKDLISNIKWKKLGILH